MDAITGVSYRQLSVFETAGGPVLRMLREQDPEFTRFGEIYCSEVHPGAIKAWKRHLEMTQHFIVPVGRVLFALYDPRPDSATSGAVLELELGRPDNYGLLTLPPHIWYGFKGIGDQSSLIVNCTDMIHRPDESQRLEIYDKSIPYTW